MLHGDPRQAHQRLVRKVVPSEGGGVLPNAILLEKALTGWGDQELMMLTQEFHF